MKTGYHQLGRAIALETMFRSYMGANYHGAHEAAREIFVRKFIATPAELEQLERKRPMTADLKDLMFVRSRVHFGLGGSAETLAAIEAIDRERNQA